jgi:hypothetical protein
MFFVKRMKSLKMTTMGGVNQQQNKGRRVTLNNSRLLKTPRHPPISCHKHLHLSYQKVFLPMSSGVGPPPRHHQDGCLHCSHRSHPYQLLDHNSRRYAPEELHEAWDPSRVSESSRQDKTESRAWRRCPQHYSCIHYLDSDHDSEQQEVRLVRAECEGAGESSRA